MNISGIFSTVGMIVAVSRACKPNMCNEKQDAWGPPSSWKNRSAAFKPGWTRTLRFVHEALGEASFV
jgi:hypothetical protein